MLMFDDSFQLSEQYFTVLQLLRIFWDWIGEVEGGFDDLKRDLLGQFESWQVWRRQYAPEDEDAWPLDMDILEENFGKVRSFFDLRVNPLKERIRRKQYEVESLRDGVRLFSPIPLFPFLFVEPRMCLTSSPYNPALQRGITTRSSQSKNAEFVHRGFYRCYCVLHPIELHGSRSHSLIAEENNRTLIRTMQTFWAIPFMTQSPQTPSPVPSGFATSFVAVPVFTYLLSAVFIIWVWSCSSRSFKGFLIAHTLEIAGFISRNTILVLDRLRKVRFKKKAKNNESDQEGYTV